MGTSTSSTGAGTGASFDPPWLDDAGGAIDSGHADTPLAPGAAPPDGSDGDDSDGQDENQTPAPPPTGPANAPSGRYREARRALTGFVRSGSGSDLRRGVSSFVKKGMGGPARGSYRATAR